MIIIVPTYLPHYKFIQELISSFSLFCQDKENLKLKLIVSGKDLQKFKMLAQTADFSVEVVCLFEIIKKVDNEDIYEEELLAKGVHNYQSIKKIYGVKYFGADQSIVLDSENKAVAPFKVADLFEYFQYKTILYSDYFGFDVQEYVTQNSKNLIGLDNSDQFWLFETSFWYYEKYIVDDLFNFIRDNYGKAFWRRVIDFNAIFEWVVYAWFIFAHNDKYKYNFICSNQLLESYLGEEFIQKLKNVQTTPEYSCRVLELKDIEYYCKYLKDSKLQISRLHWINKDYQDSIIQNSNTKIGTYT